MALSLLHYSFDGPVTCILKERNQMEQRRSMVITTDTGGTLHENLIMEILSWLPVKWLMQFKIVCKSWYAIISSPQFIARHLKNYNHNNKHNNGTCLLAQYYVSHAELNLVQLLMDDEKPQVLANEVLDCMPMYSSYIYGPCQGIYYLYHYTRPCRALWNPVTNELNVLPPIVPNPRYAHMDVYGFGFDSSSDDYKVVIINDCLVNTNEADDDSEVIYYPNSVVVYSLRTDLWKHCGYLTKHYFLIYNKCYVFVNGCTYWLGSCPQNEVIIRFDFGADAFSEMCVPNYDKPASNSVGVYRDCVAFFTAGNKTDQKFNIWTLNVEGFWTKVLTMGPIPNLWNPVGHWEDDKVILELECQEWKLFLCDTNTQELWDLAFGAAHFCKGVFAYRESLVSPKRYKSGHQPGAVINGDLQDG